MRGEKQKPSGSMIWFGVFLVILVCCEHLFRPKSQSAKLPSAEQVGESVGRRAIPFAKGFARGLCDE